MNIVSQRYGGGFQESSLVYVYVVSRRKLTLGFAFPIGSIPASRRDDQVRCIAFDTPGTDGSPREAPVVSSLMKFARRSERPENDPF